MGEMIQKNEYDELKEKYDELNNANRRLVKEMDRVISEYAKLKLKEDYNKWATHEEAKKFFESLQQEPIKLSPVLSEVPNMVINTKNLYLTFDNHTNNFKEDDTND